VQNDAYESVVQQILMSRVKCKAACGATSGVLTFCRLRSVDMLHPENGVFSPRCVTWIHATVKLLFIFVGAPTLVVVSQSLQEMLK
jgi:hypothetical protein